MFVIIFQCFDIINKMQAELKGRLYNGNYSNLAGIETKCDVCMNHLKAEYNQAGELEAMSIDVPDKHRQKEHLETAKMIIKQCMEESSQCIHMPMFGLVECFRKGQNWQFFH